MNTRVDDRKKQIKCLRADKLKVKVPPPPVSQAALQQKVKVKVQYIHNHKIVDSDEVVVREDEPEEIFAFNDSVTEEVENVEYLDDVITIDHDMSQPIVTISDDFQDTFYPNAIQCLIALYHKKYPSMQGKDASELCAMEIWHEISREMKECYFDFDSRQVQEKYRRLRQQYFDLKTRADVEAFDYFNNLHQIYQDSLIQQLLTGAKILEVSSMQRTHCDDVMFAEESEVVEEIYPLVSNEIVLETGDIEEKEPTENHTEIETTLETIKHEITGSSAKQYEKHKPQNEDIIPIKVCAKRLALNRYEFPAPRKKLRSDLLNLNGTTPSENSKQDIETTPAAGEEMSLMEYNNAQQRRHEENMQLMRESLHVQEALLEMQGKVLQALERRL